MKIVQWLAVAVAASLGVDAADDSYTFGDLASGSSPAHVRSGLDQVKQQTIPTPVPVQPVSPKATPAKTGPATKPVSRPSVAPVPAPAPATPSALVPATPSAPAPVPAPTTAPAPAPSTTPAPVPVSPVTTAPAAADDDIPTQNGGFLKPFATEEPSSLFKRNPGLAKVAPIINVKKELLTTRAIPTNKWWGNLIHTTEKERGTHSNPAWSNPYALKFPIGKEGPYGLQACYSYTYRKKADLKDGKIKYYLHEYHNDVTLSAAEFTAEPTYEVYDWTDMGINVRICSGTNCMDSALLTGMAFVSADYKGLTPHIATASSVTKFEQVQNKYVLQLSNKQTWVMYTSTPGSFKLDNATVKASAPYTGTIRLAVLPDGATTDVYDAYAGCVVRGGVVSVESRTQYTLNWQTNGSTCATGGLLHFALQHQLDSMKGGSGAASQNATGSIVLQSTTRGAMTGVAMTTSAGGVAQWKMTEPELKEDIGFYPPRKIDAATVTQLQLKEKLQADISAEWLLDGASYYFTGKAYQKYASLCLMADDVAVMGDDKTLVQTCVKKLEGLLDKFLTNSFPSPLIYETTYRGITTIEAITKNDVNADFGNGIYNDHHYHYGYWVAGSAMLRKLDPKWTRMGELESIVWTMLRDVANPSTEDVHFPTFRHFSWYLGHSVSHGATPLADGKDQESTSEDMNFFYGMMLWGKVTGNKAVEDLGSLMLRIDARAIRTYFLMDSSNKVHPPEFAKNHVTGIFFDNKVDYASWFSAEKYCIHGIQMIPVSPINEIVRTPQFVKEEWDDVLSKEVIVTGKDMTNAWNSLLYANYAVINKAEALSVLSQVKMDDGLTRSWALYVAATRPSAAA